MSKRYGVVCHANNFFVVSLSSLKILKALQTRPRSYEQLHRATKIPLNTLYVLVSRFKKLGLAYVIPRTTGRNGRVFPAEVTLEHDVTVHDQPKYLR